MSEQENIIIRIVSTEGSDPEIQGIRHLEGVPYQEIKAADQAMTSLLANTDKKPIGTRYLQIEGLEIVD